MKNSAIKTYQSYKDFNENEPYYTTEVNAYLKAQADTKELVSLLHSIPFCEFNGCPHHSENTHNENFSALTRNPTPVNTSANSTPVKNNKRKDEEGFITSPSRKTVKRVIIENPSQNILSTANRFQNLHLTSNEVADSLSPSTQ
ncbi:hypothetical protein NPIL_134131 [Nephila pilipes]|uniref:Uncharacterized protein n=1 Tax=Nephila pilipes TaxID=299642 RepID=A0A8X6QSE6_NEPPI|nr:hypothetical protein NPIL_134131 [Nephila pilipes]